MQAEQSFAAVFDTGSTTDMQKAIGEVEYTFEELRETAKKYAVYCVGHAHIDMNWMWSWPETVAVTLDTFTSVLRLMDEFSGFHFSQSQASVYRIVEKYRPAMLDAIAKRIEEGRWEVTASHWVETDKNIVSAESLCRHVLNTRTYMKELFGLEPADVRIDWSPDTFGHAHTVPTYLQKAGISYLYLHRAGSYGSQPRPRAFVWRGPDGSKVLTWNDMVFGYNGTIGPEVLLKCLVSTHDEASLPFTLYVYGVGDHGGGPTRRDLLKIMEMNSWPLFPSIQFSRVHDFYARLEQEADNLPLLDEELNFEFTGCYTSQTLIKKANRYAEKLLVGAETASVVSEAAAGVSYPYAILNEGWQNTLFNHFHDIIPGTGVRDTRTHAHGLFQETAAGTGSIRSLALRKLADEVNTAQIAKSVTSSSDVSLSAGVGKGAANGGMSEYEFFAIDGSRIVLLFNELPYNRAEVVETTIWEGHEPWEDLEDILFIAISPDGTSSGVQVLERGLYWGHRFIRIAFQAQVPGIGYSTYRIFENDCDKAEGEAKQLGYEHVCPYANYELGTEGLENSLLKVDFDGSTGGIRKLTDKTNDINLINSIGEPPCLLHYLVEQPVRMNAWERNHAKSKLRPQLDSFERGHAGPLEATIKTTYSFSNSTACLVYRLKSGDPQLYLDLEIEWNESGDEKRGTPTLRLEIPVGFESMHMINEIPFGAISRFMEHGEEVPALRWTAAFGTTEGKKAGLLLMNDSKHGYALQNGILHLNLIRASYYPDTHPEFGNHEVQCAIRPYHDPKQHCKAVEYGRIFNHPIQVIPTDIHAGRLNAENEAIGFQSESLVLDCVKKAEDGNGTICRIHNPSDAIGIGELSFDTDIFGNAHTVSEVDLMERELDSENVSLHEGNIKIRVPANGLCSVRVITGPPSRLR